MCLLLFVYCILYTNFGGSSTGEADKIGKKIKKNPYVRRFPDEHKGHKEADVAVIFIGELTNIRPTWPQGWRGPAWRSFVGQVEPMNVRVLGLSVPPGR
jgi:hypothetical protein